MATIGSRGLVDDGSANLRVDGSTTVSAVVMTPTTLSASGQVTIGAPGFYYVSASGSAGEGLFTGSLPAASAYPGSQIFVTDLLGAFNWMLTGSSYAAGKAVFVHKSGSLPGALAAAYGGTSVSLSPFASIGLFSDGRRWCIMGGSGSMSLAGLNL